MKNFVSALILATASAVEWEETYEHTHVEKGEEARFRDVEVIYDEVEYWVKTRQETEVRTRQVPVTTEFS
jgi:hypothetical protein